eukprot:scaffold651609_cov42-Prasinocladus_malaysianus.AAC.1
MPWLHIPSASQIRPCEEISIVMAGCFRCFGGPRVDDDLPSTSTPQKAHSKPDRIKQHSQRAKSNDRPAQRLLKASKKGCRT